MTDINPRFIRQAEELLPCIGRCGDGIHDPYCPTHYRPLVAQALQEAFEEVEAERDALRAALREMCDIFRLYHQSDSGSDAEQRRACQRAEAALATKE